MKIPQVLKKFNLIVDGRGQAGVCETVKLPDLAIKTEELMAGGLDVPISVDMGMETLEGGFTMHEWNPDLFRLFGVQDQAAVQLTFRGILKDDTNSVPVVVKMQGMYKTLNMGEATAGEVPKLEATLPLRFYSLEIGGRELIYIDVPNMVRRINGVDVLAADRAALAL